MAPLFPIDGREVEAALSVGTVSIVIRRDTDHDFFVGVLRLGVRVGDLLLL